MCVGSYVTRDFAVSPNEKSVGTRLEEDMANVSPQRVATHEMLQRIIEKDQGAFAAFYERYRGRIYRFIVRQYSNGDLGKAGYYAIWRHLAIASRTCKGSKELKFAFYRFLGQANKAFDHVGMRESLANYLPQDLEDDIKWSLVFVEHFKRLPNAMKKRYLFKHEIGLTTRAIARILGESRSSVEKSLEESERTLRFDMDNEGCPASLSLDKLYRDSRVVKPPATWDGEILASFDNWLEHAESPRSWKFEIWIQSMGLKWGAGEKAAGLFERLTRQRAY
jgi:DNA-directed RNA polymerase specialized sigma24 family protein